MNCSKYLWPMVFASVMAGCSFTGGNAPISDGSATASVYTVKPGDTLYAISSRYGLDPAVVARENHLTNPLSSVGRSKTPLVRVIFNGGQYSQSRSQHKNTDEFEQLC